MNTHLTYVPGVCNIGPEEIKKRKNVGHFGLFASIVFLGIMLALNAHPLFRLFVFIPATISALGFLQARFGFCVAYAQQGVSGMESVGNTVSVSDEAAHAKDTRKARVIILGSITIGLAASLIAFVF